MAQLHDAAYHGDSQSVRDLLRTGADPNEYDDSGYTPLHWAVFKGHCGGDREGVVRALLLAGADVNTATHSGDSVLMLACQSSALPLVELIVDAGADINARSGTETPLTAAAKAGCDEAVRLLLARGADPTARGPFGLTALEWAEALGFERVVTALRADA